MAGVNFIDYFQLYHLTNVAKRNISICPKDSIKLYASNIDKRYEWSKNKVEYVKEKVDTVMSPYYNPYYITATFFNGDSTPYIYATDTGWYWNITYLSDSTIMMDSIHVYYGGLEYNSATNITFCIGDTFTLNANTRTLINPSYLWSTGETLPIIIKYNTGKYWVKTTTLACTYFDTINVSMKNKNSFKFLHDTSICFGSKLQLNGFSSLYSIYKWSTGDSSSSIIVSKAGKYTLIASDGICKVSDTATINTYLNTLTSLPHDTSFCSGGSCVLNATDVNYSKYLWNTGANTATISINLPGVYSVIASDTLGCSAIDTVKVTVFTAAPLHLVNDTFVCLGNAITLDVKDTVYNNYHWNTGTASSAITITQSGKYLVTASNGLCNTSDSVNVTIQPLPYVNLPKDTIVCFDELNSILLSAPVGFASYKWYPTNETTPSILANQARLYAVEVTDKNGCINRDTTLIDEECKLRVWIPNAFTPNNDGLNDIFKITALHASEATLQIYNRWGEQIFNTGKALQEGWDGNRAFDGEYFYIVHCSSKDQALDLKGMFRLLR